MGNAVIGAGQCVQKYALNRLEQQSPRHIRRQSNNNTPGKLQSLSNKKRSLSTSSTPTSPTSPIPPPLSQQEPQKTRFNSPVWLIGLIMCYCGEFGNVLGLAFASASIISPLGIISVFSNAILAQRILGERVTGYRQQIGYLWILIGVCGILFIAPKPSDSVPLLGIEAALTVEDWRAFLGQSYLMHCVVVLFAVAVWGLSSIIAHHRSTTIKHHSESPDAVENIGTFLVSGASFGAVSIIAIKVLSQYFRIIGGSEESRSAPTLADDPNLLQNESVSFATVILPLFLLIGIAVAGQEVMKQLALSRFPVSKFQPQYYAVYNSVVVLASSVVFQEITGGFWNWLTFFALFACGILCVVHGSSMIQSQNDEVVDKRQV